MPENDVYIPMSVYDYMMSASVDNITPKELYFELEHMSPKVISALEDRLRTVGLYTTTDISLVPFTPETESAAMSKMATALDIAIWAVAICFAQQDLCRIDARNTRAVFACFSSVCIGTLLGFALSRRGTLLKTVSRNRQCSI